MDKIQVDSGSRTGRGQGTAPAANLLCILYLSRTRLLEKLILVENVPRRNQRQEYTHETSVGRRKFPATPTGLARCPREASFYKTVLFAQRNK
ncbi:hypothetical protein EVAR_98053_1 [Eumeta japonica]|uniref:Uncharacterized protein n=1 Tax=Eumeta variegata TaxID=151549 RepID=A0A4C1WEM4_EUMVA|nr:hypothetical protein EVAR_98053_1 [Eumeta japonica]